MEESENDEFRRRPELSRYHHLESRVFGGVTYNMTNPAIHVVILDKQDSVSVERIMMNRSIAELVLVYSTEGEDLANATMVRFRALKIPVTNVSVELSEFTNILSSILGALNNKRADKYCIEFNMASSRGLLSIAAFVAAVITNATLIYPVEDEICEVIELWPSELMNLHYRKREILDFLSHQSEPISQTSITGETGIQKSGLSRHLRDLERAGYIDRKRLWRSKYVEITDLGLAVLHHKQLRKRRMWGSFMNVPHQPMHKVGQAHG